MFKIVCEEIYNKRSTLNGPQISPGQRKYHENRVTNLGQENKSKTLLVRNKQDSIGF